MSRRSVLVAVALAGLVSFWERPAVATGVGPPPPTLDFETGVAPGDYVGDQYADQGVRFGTSSAPYQIQNPDCGPNYGLPVLADGFTANAGHTGTRGLALQGCGGEGIQKHAAFMIFDHLRSKVRVRVLDEADNGSVPVYYLRGYDVDGNLVGTAEVLPINSPAWETLEIDTGSANIALATFGTEIAVEMLVDDLYFDEPAAPPDFKLNMQAAPRLYAGQSADFAVSVTRFNGSSGPIDLAISGLPDGVTGSFSPSTLTGLSTDTTLTLTVDGNAPIGDATATVTATPENLGAGIAPRTVDRGVEVVLPYDVPDQTAETAPCSPVDVRFQITRDNFFNGPLTLTGVSNTFFTVTAGAIDQFGYVTVTLTPTAQFESGFSYSVQVQLSSTGLAPRYGYISVTGVEGGIAAVSAPQVMVGPPGSSLTLTGTGLCDHSMVEFGNHQSKVVGVGDATGRVLTATTPRLATTGAIKVYTPDGRTLIASMIEKVVSFRDTRGFSWVNTDYGRRLSGDDIDRLFGKDETNIDIFGWLIRKPEATLLEHVSNKYIPGGICFGMAFAALKFYESPSNVQFGGFPHRGDTVWSLDGPDRPSDPLLTEVTSDFSLQFSDQVLPVLVSQLLGQAIGAHPADEDINNIRGSLATAPTMIGLLHWDGPSIGAHTVLAYATEDQQDGTVAVDVYNPNRPYLVAEQYPNPPNTTTQQADKADAAHLSLEITKSQILIAPDGHWRFDELGWDGPDSNLFVIPHNKLPIINGESPSLPNIFAIGAVSLFSLGSSGDAVTQVEDDQGHAVFDANGITAPASWPSGLMPFASFTGTSGLPGSFLRDGSETGPLKATVQRNGGDGLATIIGPGLAADVTAGSGAGQLDHLTIDVGERAVALATGAANTPFRAMLVSAPPPAQTSPSLRALVAQTGAATLTERLVEVSGTTALGSEETVGLPGGKAVRVAHTGPATTLAVRLGAFASDGHPVLVQLPPMKLGSGESVLVTPVDWTHLDTTTVKMLQIGGGHRHVGKLKARKIGMRFARALRARLVAGAGGDPSRAEFDLVVGKLPSAPALSIAIDVLRGAQTVATSAPTQLVGSGIVSGTIDLPLTQHLAPGRYRVRVRLLESTIDGPLQGSTVVRATARAKL